MNATTDETTDDISFDDPQFYKSSGISGEVVAEDTYVLELLGYNPNVPKRERDILYEAEQKKCAIDQIDPIKWVFNFYIVRGEETGGEFAGTEVQIDANRSLHEKATAAIIFAALAGLDTFDREAAKAAGFASVNTLVGQKMKADAKVNEKGTWNKWKGFRRMPPKRVPAPTQRKNDPIFEGE